MRWVVCRDSVEDATFGTRLYERSELEGDALIRQSKVGDLSYFRPRHLISSDFLRTR